MEAMGYDPISPSPTSSPNSSALKIKKKTKTTLKLDKNKSDAPEKATSKIVTHVFKFEKLPNYLEYFEDKDSLYLCLIS
jgi:hypothetical protein